MVLPGEVATDLEERVRLAVAGGYDRADDDRADEIPEDLVELVEYDPETEGVVAANRDAVVLEIRHMVDRRMAEHVAAEGAFPATTDCDRLTAAFARLAADSVIAREDVGYTSG